jgi:branched-chain amino acid transport system permease protein
LRPGKIPDTAAVATTAAVPVSKPGRGFRREPDMEVLFQQIINGLTLGSIYALIALGYTMVYGIIQLINFAHGEIFAAGGYIGVITLSFLQARGVLETHPFLGLFLAFILAMIYCAFLAVALENIAYRPLRGASRLALLLSALGMSIFFSNGMMLCQGVYDKAYPLFFTSGGFQIGGVIITHMQVFIIIGSVVLMIGLNIFVNRTRLGKAMRSTAQDRTMSAILGINANNTIVTTFIIGAVLAAAAGVMVGLYYGSVRFDMGFIPGIKAFAAAVLGGIGNLTGAMLGGMIIGMVEIFAAGYLASEYKDVFAFVILILVLYFRPTGIMGEQVDDTRV